MPWVSICLYMVPSWRCYLDSRRTSHDTAGSHVSHSLYLSGFLSFSGLDKSVTFLASSSMFCLLLLHRLKFKTLKPSYAASLSVISVSCYRFCICLTYREYIYPPLRKYPESMDVNKTKASRSQWCNPV